MVRWDFFARREFRDEQPFCVEFHRVDVPLAEILPQFLCSVVENVALQCDDNIKDHYGGLAVSSMLEIIGGKGCAATIVNVLHHSSLGVGCYPEIVEERCIDYVIHVILFQALTQSSPGAIAIRCNDLLAPNS